MLEFFSIIYLTLLPATKTIAGLYLRHACEVDSSSTSQACPGATPYNGLYGEALQERGTFFRLEVYKRVGISHAEV